MPTDEMNQDQTVYRLPAWRAWLPTYAQIRYAAQLKLEWAINGVPEATLQGDTATAAAVGDASVATIDPTIEPAIDVASDAPTAISLDSAPDVEMGDGVNDELTAIEVAQEPSTDELPATSMRQGMGLVFVAGLVAGFIPFLANWYFATLAGTSVALAGLVPQTALPDVIAQDAFPVLAVLLDTAATIGGLDPVGPGWLAAFLSALGEWLSWPLNWLSSWIVYGLGVLAVAKLLGAPTTLQRFYAGVSYAFVPLLLLALTPIPCAGGLLALIAAIWALIIYVLAVRVVTGFDTLRAFVSVVAPALIVLVIGVLLAGAGVFSLLSVML